MLHKDYDREGSVPKNHDRESQGVCRQDELIGGKLPVVNWLWLELELNRILEFFVAAENWESRQSKETDNNTRKKLDCTKKTSCVI
jgi:hypothetical protein